MSDPELVQQAVEEVQNGLAVLFDVRTEDEWVAEHAVGAQHFDVGRLMEGELPNTPRDIRTYTYCASGGRAFEAAEILRSNGWTMVDSLGGLSDWVEAGGEKE